MPSSTAGSNQLQTWDDKISAFTQRILALYEPTEFHVLRQLCGESAGNASSETSAVPGLREAVTAVCDALVLNLRLVEKINAAKGLRAKAPKLFQTSPEPEIETILTRPVVEVDPAELQNPALFHLAARKYALPELYDLLDGQVNRAAAVLTDATRKLRDSQELLSTVELEMKQARQSLSQDGLDHTQLDLFQTQLRSRCVKLAQDPLCELFRIETRDGITDFKTFVQERIEAVNRLAELQNDATRLNSELKEKQRQAQQVFADRLVRVQVHAGAYPPLLEDDIKNFADRLRALLAPNEDIQEVISLLQNWVVTAKSALEKTEQSLQKNQAYLDHRLELRGLLSALTAKAAALDKAEDRQISGMLNQAHTLLYQRPSPIELARELLSQVERALNQVHPSD
jgi:F0F1-type ATP synthase membrane subunit b/b'